MTPTANSVVSTAPAVTGGLPDRPPPGGRLSRSMVWITAVLMGLICIAGVVQSWRTQRQLPVIDLIVSGPEDHVTRLVTRHEYDAAIRQLEMQSRLQPSDPRTVEHLGNLLGTQQRYSEARAQFQRLVLMRPDYAEGYQFLGATHLELGQPALAARCFSRAITLKPDFAVAHNNLGVALAREGEVVQAEQAFAKAVELDPQYENACINLQNARRQLRQTPAAP